MSSVAMTRKAGHAGRQRRAGTSPPTASPTRRERRPPPAPGCRRPTTGVDDVPALRADRDPDQHRDDERHDPDRGQDAESAADRPAGTRPRRRQDDLQPTTALIARPAREERRSGQADDERPEAEERQLEQRRRLGQVEARIDRLDHGGDLRQRRDHLAERIGRGDDEDPVQPRSRRPTRARCRTGRRAAG